MPVRAIRDVLIAGAAVLSPLAMTAVQAQGFPSRSIRLVVPVPPGGGADAVARLLAPRTGELLGQQVIVDNRAGANAAIGADLVARAPADGHTWLLGTSQHTVTPAIIKSLPYDIVKDFAPVTLAARAPQMLTVHPAVPARTVKDLIALAKAQPDAINYGSGGLGSASHLSAELFSSMAGIRMTHVPYKGVGLAFVDLVGGQVALSFPAIPSGLPYHRNGRLRGLGVTSERRHPLVPDMPTIAEAALPGYRVQSWYGILVPAGTKPDVVSRIHAAVTAALGSPDTRAAIVAQGGEPDPGPAEAFAALIRDDLDRNARIARAAGMVPK